MGHIRQYAPLWSLHHIHEYHVPLFQAESDSPGRAHVTLKLLQPLTILQMYHVSIFTYISQYITYYTLLLRFILFIVTFSLHPLFHFLFSSNFYSFYLRHFRKYNRFNRFNVPKPVDATVQLSQEHRTIHRAPSCTLYIFQAEFCFEVYSAL